VNGRAARRIRRAALHILLADGTGETLVWIRKRLKREYKALPYHRRRSEMYQILTHREQERRYNRHRETT
jgi:hypothetical protein